MSMPNSFSDEILELKKSAGLNVRDQVVFPLATALVNFAGSAADVAGLMLYLVLTDLLGIQTQIQAWERVASEVPVTS